MKDFLRAATGIALVALLQFVSQPAAQGAPGDFLYETGAKVHLSAPHAIARDHKGNVYVTSLTYYTGTEMGRSVQVFDKTGKRLYKWGSYGSADGEVAYASGIAVTHDGKVYITESVNHRVQVFDSTGRFLGKWGNFGVGDGEFNAPSAIAADAAGNLYVCDSGNHRIQVFDGTGRFLRKWGSSGSDDGQFSYPAAVALDAAGNVYVADNGNFRIEVFDRFGTFLRKWGSQGQGNGQFMSPSAVAFDKTGRLLVTDSTVNAVQVFDKTGTFITRWGGASKSGGELNAPSGLAVQANGDVYVVGTANEGIAIFSSAGDLLFSWGSGGSGDGQFLRPLGLAVDPDGNVYIADSVNMRVQVFTGTGAFLRKWGGSGPSNIQYPFGVALSSNVDVFVADPYLSVVRAYTRFGTLLRTWSAGTYYEAVALSIDPSDRAWVASGLGVQKFDLFGNELGVIGLPKINMVVHVATDSKGNVYAADSGNKRIEVFDSQGNLLRIIGEGYFTAGSSGPSSTAGNPGAIAVDGNGNIYVAGTSDPTISNSNKILIFDASGRLRATWGGFGDDAGLFNEIGGIAIDKTNTKVYVSDAANNRIQVFEGFGNELPLGWLTSDVGSVGLAGSAAFANGVFTIKGAGADINGTADSFRFVYQPLTGDGQILARVSSLTNTNGDAKAGVMFRQSLAANSVNVTLAITPTYGAEFSVRTSTGGSTTVTRISGVAAPYWVKLVRSGNTFSGYIATSGGTWRLVGSSTIAMGSTVYAGLPVCSHNTQALTTATIDYVGVTAGHIVSPTATLTAPVSGAKFTAPATISITATATPGTGASSVKQVAFYAGSTLIGTATASPYAVTWRNVAAGNYSLTAVVTDNLGNQGTSAPVAVTVASASLPAPWATQDIGSVGLTGSAGYLNGVFTLKGSGAGIQGSADSFRFVYKTMTGDGQIIARVSSLQNTNGYAKSGVMIRDSLTAGSQHATLDITPSYGAEFLRRYTTGGSTTSTTKSGVAAPAWVKLIRTGNNFSAYISWNGTTWTWVGTSTIAMKSTVYVGLIVSSRNNSVLCTTTIDSVH